MDRMATDEATNMPLTSSGTQRSPTTNGRAIAVVLKPLIDLHGEPRNWATAAPLYLQALADIPPDLLAKAVRHAIASNPYFPKPADLRLSIMDELTARRGAALPPPYITFPRLEAPRPTETEKAEVVELLEAHDIATEWHGRMRMREEHTPSAKRHEVAAELRAFRLPAEDDPRVLKRLQEMGENSPSRAIMHLTYQRALR